ncbi:hypothetical protein QNH32_01345 [Priestia flexa]|uniref:hypothetical protein n=1 Tax=Priestia flexa TaxID=86664 RepID=UPI0024C0581F|nr:hypothetical protein [Priestia flexa]WHX79325.1 hypothetical protein QNH32_01345 [Priestia flexa]
MDSTLPNIEEMSLIEAIHWYTGEVAKATSREARINGMYTQEYKKSLYEWKLRLNQRCRLEN